MRNAVLLGARLLLGSYMGIHASQKLFGMFNGPGLDKAGAGFEKNGLTPGRQMAMAAAATEMAGGVLTVTGIADPAGPLAIAGAMGVAVGHNRAGGLMAARGGVELPVMYLALAATLAATGPGKYALGPRLPRGLVAVGVIGGAAAAGAMIAKMVTSTPAIASPEPEPESGLSEPESAAGPAAESAVAESELVDGVAAEPTDAPEESAVVMESEQSDE
jgi:putative oxidoreductase